ncbi:reverse transcriptase domain-containing protein [Tanacetum coccineum]
MRTRSSSNLVGESSPNPTTSNPKCRNHRRSKQPFNLEEPLENQAPPVVTMADQRTMAELLHAPTEGYAEAIVVPPILAEHFELKHSLINMMTSDQFFRLEKDNPHDHIRWFNKITSIIKYKDVPNSAIKLMLFSFSLAGAARRWLEKEPPRSILTWEHLVSKFINEFFPPSRTTNLRNEISNFEQRFGESFHEAWDRYKDLLHACPHHGFTELHQLDTFYNALNPTDQDSLNSAAGGNLLERSTQDVLMIIENKSKVRNSRNKSIVSQVKSSDVNSSSSSEIAKLTHAVNQQTSVVTTAMTAILKQFQATPPPASVKAVEEICVTCGGAHPYYQCLAADGNTFPEYRDNIQGYVSAAAVNYNQDTSYQAPIQQNQVVHLSELEKIKKINDVNLKAIQDQINNVKNELRNEMTSIQASMSNQTNELKNMMASFFQMNTASTLGSGSLPSNTVANLRGELKAITTRSGLVLDGPSVLMPPLFINPEEDERVEETLTNPKLVEYMCMRTRSSFNLVGNSSSNPTTTNPKRHNRRHSKRPFSLKESPVVMMADQRTMVELLRAPTEGYAKAIVVLPILAKHFELKHSLINMMTSDQFFGLEKDNPHDHIPRRWLEKESPRSILTWEDLVSKFINEFFPPSRTTNFRNEISNFQQKFNELFHEAWDRYKDLLRACPHHGFTELHQLDTFYNALNPADQDSLNSAAGGNLLERSTQDVLMIIENKSKVRNSPNKSIVSQVKSSDGNSSSSDIAKLTHAVNQQTSAVTTAMTAILKQFQATPPPASVKAVEEICVTCGAAAGNYNQGNSGYRPPGVVNQTRPLGFVQQNGQNNQNHFSQPQGYNRGNNFNQNANYQAPIQQNQSVPLNELEKFKKTNEANMKAMQTQINNVKNELRNEMQNSIQASMSNQTNELKNMMASFFQMNTASTSGTGSLPSNTVANPKGELKAITTRSGLVLDGPTVPMPPPFINPEEDERVEETLTDPEHGEYTIKVPPPQVQKAKPPSQRNFVIHQRDPRYVTAHIPYPSRMNQEKRQEKDEVQIHKFWQMFKQLHINISLADALILIPKYQKMLKSLLSNKEKLLKLANTPLNKNCSAVILKKLLEKLGDPGKFLISCGFSELKCKALADLVILVSPLILGRPFLRTVHALIDVHGEEMILHDGNERLTLNMRHDTLSYSTQPHQESINMIDVYNVSNEEILEDLGDIIENLLNLDKTKDLLPYHDNPLSGNPTPISEPVTKSSSSSPTLTSIEESDFNFGEGNSKLIFASEFAHPIWEDYDEERFLILRPYNDNTYFDSILTPRMRNQRVYKLLIDELEIFLNQVDFLPFSRVRLGFLVRNLPRICFCLSTNNEDKVFNPGILIHENLYEVSNLATMEKNVKNTTNASLILEDFNPPPYELPFHKEVPGLGALLLFSSENKEKVFNPGIITSKRVHTSLLPELSHRDSKAFKVIKIFESPMEIFPCSYGEDIRILDVPCLHFYPP